MTERQWDAERLSRGGRAWLLERLARGEDMPTKRRRRPRDPAKLALLHLICAAAIRRLRPQGWLDSEGRRHLRLGFPTAEGSDRSKSTFG